MKMLFWSGWRSASLVLSVLLLSPFSALRGAQPGDVDTSFNPDLGAIGRVRAVARQSDGRILAAAQHQSGRLRGKLFALSSDGKSSTLLADCDAPIWRLRVQADDKIVMAGGFGGVQTSG